MTKLESVKVFFAKSISTGLVTANRLPIFRGSFCFLKSKTLISENFK